MAAASSTGIFLGMLPLIGIRLPIAIIISLIFKLNIIALLLGIALTIIFPAVHLFSFWLGQAFAGYEVPFFSLRFLNFSHLLEWTTSGRYQLVGSIIVGLILSSILLPVFYKFYESKYTKNHQLNVKGFIFYDESGKRWWLTKRLGLAFAIIVFIVVSIFGVSLSGPDPQYTTQIMHILDKNNIKVLTYVHLP
jgi:hypothetical protein